MNIKKAIFLPPSEEASFPGEGAFLRGSAFSRQKRLTAANLQPIIEDICMPWTKFFILSFVHLKSLCPLFFKGVKKGVKIFRNPETLEDKGDVKINEIRNRRTPECREKHTL